MFHVKHLLCFWMDDNGIRQWNIFPNNEIYLSEYYKDILLNGLLYVLVYNSSKNIVCVEILKESDERWTDDEPAFYLHDFVSEVESCTDSKYKGILCQKLLIAGLSWANLTI